MYLWWKESPDGRPGVERLIMAYRRLRYHTLWLWTVGLLSSGISATVPLPACQPPPAEYRQIPAMAACSVLLQSITWRYSVDDTLLIPSLPAGQAVTFSSEGFNPVRSRHQEPGNPSWRWPIQGPVVLGYAPALPGRKGIHISSKPGQLVRAAAPGRVVYAGGGLLGYGRLIILKHRGNLLSAYGHLRKILVKEGNRVKSGQPVAELGTSNTNHPVLYFEIRRNGKPVNPLDFLPERGTGRAI